jgi:hypothetical protein
MIIKITSEELLRRYGEVSLERDQLQDEVRRLSSICQDLQNKITEIESKKRKSK